MFEFSTAIGIAYPMLKPAGDPVLVDLARHHSEEDRRDAEQSEINRIADEYLTTPAGINSLMGDAKVIDAMHAYLLIGLTSRLSPSVEAARVDLFAAARLAATHMAVNDMRVAIRQAQEAADIAAWEARQERCSEFA
jgi:hypothetical protein